MNDIATQRSDPTCQPDQIVVSTRQLPLVRRELEQLNIACTGELSSDALGLTLIDLDVASLRWATGVRYAEDPGLRDYIAIVRQLNNDPHDGEPDPLDVLLFALRWIFAREHSHWELVAGKNRPVDGTHGVGEINGGGFSGLPAQGGSPSRVDYRPEPIDRPFGPPTGTAGQGVRIAVLDTPLLLDPGQSELTAPIIGAHEAFLHRQDKYESPMAAHALFGLGEIRRRAPGATILLRRVLDCAGRGRLWDVAVAMAELARENVDIIHVPVLCRTMDDAPPLLLAVATERVAARSVIVTAAGHRDVAGAGNRDVDGAGNHAVTPPDGVRPYFPGALPLTVAVGATGEDGKPAPFSPAAPWVNAWAPGVNVPGYFARGTVELPAGVGEPGPRDFDGWARWTGTSFAAAAWTGDFAAAMCDPLAMTRSFLSTT
jgi:hypothetical protein